MLKVNQTADVQITGYTSEGEGVCRIEGCAVFVPKALRGELCRVTVNHVGKTAAHGRLEKLLWRSPHRRPQDCPYARRCGGCQLWHMDYAEELRFKAQKVTDALNRIGGQSVADLVITGGDGRRYHPEQWRAEQPAFPDSAGTTDPAGAAAPRIQIAARTQDPDPAPVSGKVWDPEALPTDAPNCTPETWVYRNKAQFPVQPQFGRAKAGFYRLHTHDVVPIDRCLIQDPAADTAKQIVQDWAERYKISAYDEIEHRGLLRHIFVRKGFVSGQVMVCLVINGRELPRQEELLSRLKWGVPGLASVVLSFNQKKTNVVLGEEFRTIYGKDYIEDSLCGFTFRLSPRSFYQVNHDQAQRLYEKAIEFANLTGRETVLDLYCGTGTITLALSRRAGRAIGVEIIPQAIEDAKENAARNGVENVEFFCADAGEAAKRFAGQQASAGETAKSFPLAGKEPPQGADEAASDFRPATIAAGPDVIVVDPPRKGLAPDVIDAMVAMAPKRIVYVSCDPATLARDVKLLTAQGYTLTQAEAFDLFPRTFHVECVTLMTRN